MGAYNKLGPPPPLTESGFSDPSWQKWFGFIPLLQIAGSGTVTSVGLSMPSIFTVSGSPVTGDSTLTATFASQAANLVLASPSGASGTPSFRALDTTDAAAVQHNGLASIQGGAAGEYYHLNLDDYNMFSTGLTAGTYTNPTITDNLDGTFTTGSGDYCFYSDSTGALPVKKYTIAGNTFTPTDGATNYLIADYNSGSPTISLSTSSSSINYTTIYPVARIFRSGTDLDIIDWDEHGKGLADKLLMRQVNTVGVAFEPGGFVLSEAATRYVTITSGYLWNGIQRIFDPSYNSSTDSLSLYYHSAGVWTKSSITQYNNTQYDDGTNLQSLGTAKYAVNWIFKSANSDASEEAYIVLGQGNYNLAQAIDSLVPSNLPPEIENNSFLIGRIIVITNGTTATQIDSVSSTTLLRGSSTIATELVTTTTNVDVSAAAAPSLDQVLTATSGTAATWRYPISSQIQSLLVEVDGSGNLIVDCTGWDLAFRSPSPYNGAASRNQNSATMTVPSGATLGTSSGVNERIIVIAYAFSNLFYISVVNASGGLNLDETGTIDVTLISATSNSNNVIYGQAATTGAPYRVLGYFDITETTAGTWATNPTFVQGMGGMAIQQILKPTSRIQPVSSSVDGSNNLLVSINPTVLDFRSSTLSIGISDTIPISSSITMTVPSGATLGTISGQLSRLILLAINNAGTAEIAIVNESGGVNLDETTLVSTTAISASATANNVIYSTTARTNVPFRVIGFIDINEAAAGTWATAPTLVQGAGGEAVPSGLGYGQTLTDMTASRAVATNYYNTTGRPIFVWPRFSIGSGAPMTLLIDGNTVYYQGNATTATISMMATAVIKPGSYYQVSNGTLVSWWELR